jgi:hypothetical protein
VTVGQPGTVVLGLGYATLDAQTGVTPLQVTGDGASVSGVIVDGGPTLSPSLVELDGPNEELHDVTARIGGPHVGKTTDGIVVNGNGALLDDVWAWRADHGTGVGWTSNTGDTGILVDGDDAVAVGLFTEHFQKYAIVWNGNGGRILFYENEWPFDAPPQAQYQHDGVLGWASLKVGDTVTSLDARGGFFDCLFLQNPSNHVTSAIETPTSPAVAFQNVGAVSNIGHGVIDHLVNTSGSATPSKTSPVYLAAYP